jgi:STAS-like domain of unknown function (DUF4325)
VARLKSVGSRYYLADLGSTRLWTREPARTARAAVEELLAGAQLGEVVVIDLDGVEVFDYSFAAELFGRLLQRLPIEYPGRFLVVEHLGESTRANLEPALEDLGLTMIELLPNGDFQLIGKAAEEDRITFRTIAAGSVVSAPELADDLGIKLTTMNERLAKLVRLGVIRRDAASSGQGRSRYRYSTVG